VSITVADGRNFVRRSDRHYDVIQASLVDTWAATAAGAYTLTENSLYTTEAFGDYLDHLSENGLLTITRWVFDGLRLVSLAQEACARRGLDAARHLAVVRHQRVATFLLKRTPFTQDEVIRLLGQLHASDLLTTNVPPDVLEVFDRGHKTESSKRRRSWVNPMALRIPLWDPGAFLDRHARAFRLIWSRWGAIAWCAVVIPALLMVPLL
jgi:hypothetical protein